eukprot:g31086.t1
MNGFPPLDDEHLDEVVVLIDPVLVFPGSTHEFINIVALHEVEKAIHQLKNNKAAGADGVPAEAMRCGDKELLLLIHFLVCLFEKEESIPGELQDAMFMSIFKKGNKSDY